MTFSLLQFVAFIFVFALLVTYAIFGFSPKRMMAYFATREGKGALKGIVVFTLGGALFLRACCI